MENGQYWDEIKDRITDKAKGIYDNLKDDRNDYLIISVKRTIFLLLQVIESAYQHSYFSVSIKDIDTALFKLDDNLDEYLNINIEFPAEFDMIRGNIETAEKEICRVIVLLYPFADFSKNGNSLNEYYNMISDLAQKKKIFDGEYQNFFQKVSNLSVADYQHIFENEVKSFNCQAIAWMLATLIIIAIAIFLGIHTLNKAADLIKDNNIIFLTTTKIFILSLFYLIIHTCIKNYKVAKHNALTYKQRAKSLQTFRLFYESANSQDVKDMILLQTTNTIFNHQNTGYFSAGENDAASMEYLVKLFNTIKKT